MLQSHGTPKLRSVQRPRAAEGDERVVTRIPTPLHRYRANGSNHVRGRHRVDAVGSVFDGKTGWLRDFLGDGTASLVDNDGLGASRD